MLGQTLSHYKIVKQIGAGGMGVVYEAEDLILNRKVAIKTLKDLSAQKPRFLREARAISRINHPNIATIYDYGESEDKRPFIVMELVEGRSLDKHLKEGPIVLSKSVKIIVKVADALTAAHQKKIIHRDIKPSNVIVGKDVVKVLDFGLSKEIEAFSLSDADKASVLDLTKTQKGIIMGTPLYLSPEQASGKDVDERTDIFSLGTVLYESITGVSPFYSESVAETYVKILRDDPVSPSGINPAIPPALEQITLRALAKDPAGRYQSAAELAEKLRSLPDLSDKKIFTPPTPPLHLRLPSQTISQQLRSGVVDILRSRYLGVIAFLLAVIIGAVFYFPWSPDTYEPATTDAKRSYDRGEAALNDGLYLTASDYFKQAISQDATYAMAHARYGEASFEVGLIDEAAAAIEKANTLINSQKTTLSLEDRTRLRAIKSTLRSDFSSAVTDYHELAANAYGNRAMQAYLDLGRAYERSDDPELAIRSYNSALATVKDLPSAELRLGVLYGRRLDLQNSSEHFSRAEQLYRQQHNPEGDIEVGYQRGLLLSAIGDSTKAQDEIREALEKANINKIPYQQVKCLLLMSRILRSVSSFDEAFQYANQAMSISLQNNINYLHAQSILELGTVYFFQDKNTVAIDKYNEAIRLARQYQIPLIENRALLQLGALNVRDHKADEALDYIGRVQDFFEKGWYQIDMLDLLSIKAQAMTTKGNFLTAFNIYTDLRAKADAVGHQVVKARAQKGIGTTLAEQEDMVRALPALYESYSMLNSMHKPYEAGYSLFLRADILAQLGRYQEADLALMELEGYALAQKNSSLIALIELVKAKMALSRKQPDKAIRLCQKMLSDDREYERPSSWEAQSLLAIAYAQTGQGAKARHTIDGINLDNKDIEKPVVAKIYLARAEVMLANDQSASAEEAALTAQKMFKELGKPSFEWQAWRLLGLAQQKLKNTAAAESMYNSSAVFSTLQQNWGKDYFKSYSERPDIKLFASDVKFN